MKTLKELRAETGRKQGDVAEQAGICREYLSRVENGKKPLSQKLAVRLGEIYHESPMYLMGFEDAAKDKELQEKWETRWGEMEKREAELLQEIQTLRQENEALKKENAELRHDRDYLESLFNKLVQQLDKINSLKDTETDAENA